MVDEGVGEKEERRKTDREKRGNYCSVNGIQSNFLLLKKSFIHVDSLLVMYSSVTPCSHPAHTQYTCVCVCGYDGAVLLFLQGRRSTDKINM